MKIGLAQIDTIPGEIERNLQLHLDCIEEAVAQQADLVVFPELSLTGDAIGPVVPDISLLPTSDELAAVRQASQSVDVVVGLMERSETSLYNRYNSAFYFSKGELVHRHRKLFLVNYAVFDEAKHFVPGNNLQAFDIDAGRACMLVCNDVWHAAAPYIAALDGAEMLIVPANSARGTLDEHLNIPQTWENMTRAYSGTMGLYTVFVNRSGTSESLYGAYPYWGGSEIISPRGEVIVKAPYNQDALVFGEVDLSFVAEQRYHAPILRDARLWIIAQEMRRLSAKRTGEIMLEEESITHDAANITP
jgi:predicted amidohydrolase